MSAKKLSNGEKKVVNAWCDNIKDTAIAAGLSYGHCRKILALDYIQDAIKDRDNPESNEEGKPDKRIGNQFWKARSSHGRKPIFSSPDQLWKAALEYFEWVEANPLYEMKAFAYQGKVTTKELPKMRAMTIDGLCIFLDIGESTWNDYCHKEDFSGVTTRVDKVIRTQKFSGAAADLLNPNIIARDLGLKDKKELAGPGGGPMEFKQTFSTVEEVEAEMKRRGLPMGEI